MPSTRGKTLQTTTVRLPRRLYEEAREAVEEGRTSATSLNELLVQSLSQKLKSLRRKNIDDQFAEMKNDAQYHRQSQVLEEEFAANDSETLRLTET